MKKLLSLILILYAVPYFTSCDTSSDNAITLETMCPEPRPEVCTLDYNPVCGYKSDKASKTYSNGCSACSEKEIVGYKNGECP